jgi:hypothetical protein
MAKADDEAEQVSKTKRRLEKLQRKIVAVVAKRLKGDEEVRVALPNGVQLVIDAKGLVGTKERADPTRLTAL